MGTRQIALKGHFLYSWKIFETKKKKRNAVNFLQPKSAAGI